MRDCRPEEGPRPACRLQSARTAGLLPAARDGFAWYRGRYISVRREFVPFLPKPTPAPNHGKRLEIFTWNTSGFSSEIKAELFLWLRSQRHISAFLLQETHWGFTNEWKRDGWYLFHSAASKPRTGGVLTAIRTEIVREEDLSWKEIIPGRLTQVRCHFGRQQADIVNIYQHAWSPKTAEQTQELVRQRARLWHSLDTLLDSLPLRSELIIAGDLNTVLEARTSVAGPGIHLGNKTATYQNDRDLIRGTV